MESEQLRRECDASGPQDELEYWKRRGAQFSQLVAQLRAPEVRCTLLCLAVARAKVLRIWRDTDRKITYCYNEARDNAKYIQCMEKCCHSLYLHDPVRMKDCVLSLLQTVRLIHNVSQYYNTSERTSSLMVKYTRKHHPSNETNPISKTLKLKGAYPRYIRHTNFLNPAQNP
ncbi:Dynein heavy chain 8 [Gryllus bimaculatus]|nr:Dynein heavy chain 8 [Gryllus bimaculatus]